MDANTAEEAINRYRSAPDVPNVTVITATDHGSGINADPFFADRTEPFPSQTEQFSWRLAWAADVVAGRTPSRVIKYYVLGTGEFRESVEWPPKGIVETAFYLSKGGVLQRNAPATGQVSYDVDFTATSGDSNRWYQGPPPRYAHRKEQGSKLLIHQTPILAEDLELAGWPVVSLEPNTLPYDPGPAPHSFMRTDGLPVVPGEKFSLAFKMFSVAALIKKGHALRLAIAGADADTFRRLSEPLFLEAPPERFDIFTGGVRGSKLSLPLRPWK